MKMRFSFDFIAFQTRLCLWDAIAHLTVILLSLKVLAFQTLIHPPLTAFLQFANPIGMYAAFV